MRKRSSRWPLPKLRNRRSRRVPHSALYLHRDRTISACLHLWREIFVYLDFIESGERQGPEDLLLLMQQQKQWLPGYLQASSWETQTEFLGWCFPRQGWRGQCAELPRSLDTGSPPQICGSRMMRSS